ncbi:Hydrocephalus-inducing protein-like protein [Larimichthys crocea]|uniref:Uncharacterized protein n=1 Tax=Larimichthys crocea TaxID=215358 RepID=A0ACD3QFI9_LARCR|nr:Hydrocephalus-inducing protein-like protein [Larimichthys crocea]
MQVTVDFNPMTVGDHSQDLLLHYHTGEDVSISLYGACEELNVHLEPDSALLKEDLPFSVHHTESVPHQQEESSALQQKEEEDEEEKERLLSLCESDPTAIHRLPVLSKTLQERRSRAVQDHRLAVSHGCITVEPAEGEIWPNITTQFVIVFKPEEAKLYQEAIYCDITGRQSRLPLTIKGEGVGPKIELSYNLMDMKNVFISEKDCYEVLLCNRGLIDAPFKLSTPNTTFGRCFSLSPEEGVVPTGASQIVEVTFHTRILGTFSEDLLLTVTGQPEPLTLTFRGCVIGPTFDFNVSDLNFGDVGFGFPKTLSCSLFNSSYVPMTFALRVLGDGLGSPSVTWEQLSNGSKHNWQVSAARDLYARPAEFAIRPATGSVRSMSDITIKVTLCANTVRRYRLALVVDVEGVGEEIRTLPINARCVVPDVMVESTVLNFERCFLDYPYEQQVRLHNTSSLPACYSVLSEEDEESLSLQCGSSKPRGVIPPHSSEVLPVFLVAKAIGRLYQPLHIAVIGSVQPPLEVVLSCIGQGPIIHIQSSQLDFGRIQVLTDSTRVLLVSNESPIPAHFTARMKCRRKSFWRVEPSVGEVPPESQLDLRVVAHLKDTLPFVDKLEVSVLHGQTHTVPLFATGTGTTIVSDRPFAPSLDLGTYFSPGTCQYHFKLTNHGLRTHLMYWQNDSFLSSTKTHKGRTLSGGTILPPISTPRKKDIPGYGSVSSSGEKPPVFSLSPSRVELFPGCSADMVLTGSLDCPKVVRERLKCRAIVGDQRSYEHIMAVDVTCRFEATMVNISPKQLNFYIKKVPGKSLMPLYEKFILTNVSPLSLSMELRVVEPFSLSEAPGASSSATTKSMVIGDGRQAELWVCFNPAFCLDGMSRVMDEFLEVHYQGHPKQDMVELHAEVHFPNLHFSSTTVDFGCVLNYTETRRQIWITNCSPLPVSYCWAFLETIRDTEKPEAEEEQRNRENETEEGWRSSRTASPASSVSLRQRPGPEEDSSTSHVFDILPHHGHLPPGEKQQVTLCFFGHENVSREAVAQCRVEEGPTYNIKLRGEASVISYSLDSTHVDFGLQLFDHVAEAEILKEKKRQDEEEGEQRKVLEDAEQQPYVQQQDENGLEVTPGRPRVVPAAGYIDAGAEQCLCVLYLPGVPEAFKKRLQLQVAYLEPQDITLTGEGVFPRIILNLPQNLLEECYSDVVQQARTAVEADRVRWELTNGITTGGGAATEVGCTLTSEELLHMEIERMLVKENALAVTSGLLDLRDSQGSSRKWHKLSKYVQTQRTHTHTHTLAEQMVHSLDRSENCVVEFKEFGFVNYIWLSFCFCSRVTGGPVVQVRLCAVLTVPAVTVSTDTLEFDNVQCGMCQMRTIQLLNHESVPCYWSIAEEVKPFKKVDKFLPLYERKKVLQERRPPPVVFEMIPSSGLLTPGERVNVQIKFSPAEEHAYSRQLVVSVADSTQQVFLTAQGQGEEPQLDFCPPVLELGPCLPVSTEIEAKVVVRNPCSFPIEFYSLELDTQYLEEEKILRLMQGYDENNRLLLPPRVPAELKEDLDEKENGTDEEKRTNESEEEMHTTSVKPAEQHKGSTAAALARHYSGACLSVDAVVTDVLMNGTSPVSLTARQIFDSAAAQYAERIAEQATEEITDLGPAADLKASDPAPKSNPAPHHNVEELPKASKDSCSTNNSKEAPQQSESVEHLALCLGGDVTSLRNLLPEQLLVDILAERLQNSLKDCYRGIVIGSLESVYTQSVASTLQVVLKALNNRKHIYVVNLSDSYAALKARERAQRETEEALEKEKAEREEKWLQELDDEEYDALPEEEKERIVHWHREKLRQKKLRELERMEKEQEEKRQQEEMKRLREEELKKKSKKAGKSSLDSKELLRKRSLLEGKQSSEALNRQRTSPCNTSKESLVDVREQQNSNEVHHGKQSEQNPALHAGSPQPTEKLEREKSSETAEMKKLKKEKEVKKSINSGAEMDNKGASVKKSPSAEKEPAVTLESHRTSPPNPPKEPQLDAKEQTEHLNGDASKSNIVHQSKAADPSQKKTDEAKKLQAEAPQSADKVEGEMSTVDELQSHFIVYEQSQEQVEHILRHWDRAQGSLLVPLPSEEGSEEVTPPVGKRSKKANSKILSPMPSATAVPVEAGKSGDEVSLQYVIPHLVLNVTSKDYPSATEMLKGSILPPLDDDEDEEKKDSGENLQASVGKEGAAVTPSKTRSKSSRESAVTKEQEKKSRESQRTKKRTLLRVSSTSDCSKSTQDQHQETLELIRKQSLTKFRWVIPANDEVVLRIWFYTDSPGKFEQTFSFELLGTQRQYQLLCRGVCTYPSICKDYRTLFALSKRAPRMEEGIQKTYLIKPGCFEFGPLLCGKNRDRYKENKYPENTERLVIHNNSGLEAEVQFRFQHDTQATTYLLDPPAMTLKPDQKQELAVWAYPTKLGQIKDSVVCHIKDNPELVIIDLSCWGVRPELKLESKHLHFDRILLHRLQGVEELGDEFTVPQDQGVISPNSSCSLTLHFTAKKQVHIKKILRLEVSDVEKILGIVQTENIHVNAEAYDIALEISPDDCMDFGTIKVFEEAKLSLRMKNQGKYEIAYKFSFQQTDPTQPKPDSIFIVSPQSGALMPHSKPTLVQILCKPNTEVLIREQPVLSCQVIEPSIGDEGETIAILPVTVSVKSVFSRYTITPAYDINFGPLVYGSKKNLSFTIENNGVFETCFTIYCTITDPASPGRAGMNCREFAGVVKKPCDDMGQGKKMSQESLFGAAGKPRSKSIQKDTRIPQNCLTMGVFSVSPCTGSLQPGSQQVVTVNCAGEQLGNWSQILLIDISDRDPSVQPEGIPYRLLAEVCRPGITLDMASIFEEHHQCNNSSQLSSEQFCNAEGIYVQEENKFVFNKVLVGQTARARFKLTNNSKVPCVLSLAIRYASVRAPRNIDVFDLSVTTLSIPSQSHSFAVITFTPQTMQLYSAVFEATIEGTSRSRTTPTFKSKELEFNLTGEGNLPSVCVVRPALRNSRGGPVLQFRRVLVGRRLTLPLVLLNDGNIPAQVNIDMLDKHGVFTLKAAPGNTCSSIHCTQLEGSTDSEHQLVHRAILRLDVNKQAEFEVGFCSDKPLSVKAKMSLRVEDNQYSCTTIPVTVEAYQEILSLSNISRTSQEIDQEDDVEGNHEVLNFGDCHVDCPYQESFTMTNHSSSQAVRFEWPPAGPHVCFSPQVGHLHAGCSKEVTVTFHSNQPVTVASQPMRCKVSQVEFQQPLEQVIDWDDRKRTVQWLSSSKQGSVTPQQHVKNKVIKTDPEPSCSVVEGSQWELELHISAVCDYVKFSCNTDSIHFKDTMLYQSRLHQLQIVNHSKVKLEFSFDVLMDNTANHGQGDKTHNSRPSSRSVQTGARPASALASVMSLLMGNPELPPISVEPSIGAIEPSATQTFNIRFSPLGSGPVSGQAALQDGDQAPCISVCGRSLLPHCHFDLEESDYISGIRCSRGHLDPNTRVIEFNAVGFSTPLTRSFTVQNPTSKPYLFKWRCEDTGGSPFCCLTPSGTIQPGKKVDVRFKYVPEQLDVVESFWSFVVESLSLSVPFLCVGTTRQPLVYLDRPHVDFGELLVGCHCRCPSHLVREGYVSFRLVLTVKRKSEPLALTVKADCFTMRASVQVENPGGGLREISPNHQDTLDFGKVEISEKSTVNFLVSNLARFSLEVNFELTGPSELLQHLEVRPQNATAEVEKQLQSSLFFCPQSICNLQDVRLSIKVKHGPKFIFAIKGTAVAPSLEFSFTKYNFGKCFLHCPGMVPASQTLVIGNKGERDMSVQCQFKNTSYLEIDFQTDILSPGAVMEVPVSFYPRETCRYHEKLSFILNSCVTKQVEILGQGIEMKLEVEDLRQKTVKTVKLGSLMLGQKVKKQVVLVNRSPVEISFTLLLNTNTLPEPRDLSISPASQLRLKAGASCNVEIQFSPRQHIPPFTAELLADFAGLSHPLLTIQGCCRGVEVELDQNHLSFGAVVQHCEAKKKIFMMNTGDIGSKFQWKTENFPTELSITPAKGYIGPGMQVPFELTFAPVELSNDARFENLSCCVKDSSSPVTLTVTGSCIVASTSKEVVSFVCPVRGSQTQTLRVSNPMNQHCTIRPVIEGEQWSAATSVILKPLQQETYKITYRPLTMTAEGNKHLGSVFFPFPDGTGMLYSLQGTAEPPKAEDTIVHELPAKTHHTLLLPVHNWHSKQQRFRVLIEILKPDKPDAAVSLKGLQYIDVPALAKADYKMSFFTYKEGQYNSKVTFRNVSGEYLFYFVTFEATSPGVLSTIELVTPVRQKASATVQVENPLTTATYLTTECKSLDISAPSQHTVPGQSKGSLSFEYQPLRVGESTARLTLCSNDLGYFHYDLLLRALPAPPEKAVHFNTSLGSSHSVPVKFFNYSRVKTEYSCKTDCSHFTVDKSVGASPGFQAGSETSVEVCFDPHQLGEVRGQLTLSSTVGGEYIFPLHGMCLTPKAQGPFSIKAGRNVAIPFKNIFLQTTAFSFQVDNPCFTVKGVDTIPSKKTQNIMVSFELPAGGSPGPWFGNLTITSQRSEGHNKPCSWVFYLKGHRPET